MKRVIWLVLAVFAVTIIAVVFSGGLVDDSRRKETGLAPEGAAAPGERSAAGPAQARGSGPASGSMAYDRFLPGGRQGHPGPSPQGAP